jgi:hypothetical protein
MRRNVRRLHREATQSEPYATDSKPVLRAKDVTSSTPVKRSSDGKRVRRPVASLAELNRYFKAAVQAADSVTATTAAAARVDTAAVAAGNATSAAELNFNPEMVRLGDLTGIKPLDDDSRKVALQVACRNDAFKAHLREQLRASGGVHCKLGAQKQQQQQQQQDSDESDLAQYSSPAAARKSTNKRSRGEAIAAAAAAAAATHNTGLLSPSGQDMQIVATMLKAIRAGTTLVNTSSNNSSSGDSGVSGGVRTSARRAELPQLDFSALGTESDHDEQREVVVALSNKRTRYNTQQQHSTAVSPSSAAASVAAAAVAAVQAAQQRSGGMRSAPGAMSMNSSSALISPWDRYNSSSSGGMSVLPGFSAVV